MIPLPSPLSSSHAHTHSRWWFSFATPVSPTTPAGGCLGAVTRDGKVLASGGNESGQLGLGEEQKTCGVPTEISVLSAHRIVQVACGAEHSAVRDPSWLALNSFRTTESGVSSLTSSRKSDRRPQAVSADGLLFAWGRAMEGQCGIAESPPPSYSHPQQVLLDQQQSHAARVACG